MSEEVAKEGLRKVFVGGLDRNTEDDRFRDHFQQYGNIVDFVIIKDSNTRKSKGFGFVTYDCVASADGALAARPHMIDGREVDIKRAIPREQNTDTAHQRTKKLFVGGLPTRATEKDIIGYFHEAYPGKGIVEKCDLIKNKETGASRGFAFIELSSEDFSDLIVIDNCSPIICGKQVEIKKAEERRGGGGGGDGKPRGGGGSSGRGRGGAGGSDRYGGGNQRYGNGYQDYGGDAYGGGPGGFQNQGGYGNVFYPNVGYGGGYGPVQGQEYGGGYGHPYGNFGGAYNQTQSGYGPVRDGGMRRGGGSQRGGRPY